MQVSSLLLEVCNRLLSIGAIHSDKRVRIYVRCYLIDGVPRVGQLALKADVIQDPTAHLFEASSDVLLILPPSKVALAMTFRSSTDLPMDLHKIILYKSWTNV